MIQPASMHARHWAAMVAALLIGLVECARLARSRLVDTGRSAWPRLTRR